MGYRQKGEVMKKRLLVCSVMMCMFIALMATGCAKKAADQAQEVVPPQKTAPAETGQDMKLAGTTPADATTAQAPAVVTGFDKKIFFDFDKFDLNPESTETLNELAAFLKANKDIKGKIEGNCDERGTTEYNLALGERRAKAAMDYLTAQGIDAARLATISYGKEKPADPAHNEDAWAKNRRDEFILTK
jgi:peptidoglycan-associated lipoprotein